MRGGNFGSRGSGALGVQEWGGEGSALGLRKFGEELRRGAAMMMIAGERMRGCKGRRPEIAGEMMDRG